MNDKQKFEEQFLELFKEFDRAWDTYYKRSNAEFEDFYKYGWECDRILDIIRDMYNDGKIKF